MKTVRFLRRQWPYQAGEIAGFDDRLAARYVEDGAAVPAEPARTPEVHAPAATAPALQRTSQRMPTRRRPNRQL